MSTNEEIICKVYGSEKKFSSRKDAMRFFLECMMSSEGSEQERYTKIYCQLEEGKNYCSDED